MIQSATEILKELQHNGTHFLPSEFSVPDNKNVFHIKHSKKEFAICYVCTQARYLRTSWKRKMRFLESLLSEIKTLDSLVLLLNTLYSACGKLEYYSKFIGSTNFVYDKILLDHNRALEKSALNVAEMEDIDWFRNLNNAKQTSVMIGLLRISGGAIIHNMYKCMIEKYNNLKENPRPVKKTGSSKLSSLKSETTSYSLKSDPYLIDVDLPLQNRHKSSQLPIIPNNIKEVMKFDPNNPFTIEVEKRRKQWDTMINKYRIEVEGKPKKEKKPGKLSKKKSKKDKSTKSAKSEKSKKSAKSSKSKKGKKGKKGMVKNEALDWIQLLPIWIIKKIFDYLDQKSLKKAKSVNSYWDYVIKDLLKEQKTRKKMDKDIKKMEAKLNLTYENLSKFQQCEKISKPTPRERRINKLINRGATNPNLRIPFYDPLEMESLISKAPKQMKDSYCLPVDKLLSFPRSSFTDENLHQTPSCILCDIGYIIDKKTSEGEQQQINFNLYENENTDDPASNLDD